MEKSKVPFKTNVNQSIRIPAADRARRRARAAQSAHGGVAYWLRPGDRPLKATVVNEDEERTLFHRKILNWLLIFPFAVLVAVRLVLLIYTLLH